jgi:ribosome-associated protein
MKKSVREELERLIRSEGKEIFSRSGGPGGQNVNKVNTKVTLKVSLERVVELLSKETHSKGTLPPEVLTRDTLSRMVSRLGNRVNSDSELVVHASEARTQKENRELAVRRAVDLIAAAMDGEKKRRPTRPGKKAHERRLKEKKMQSDLKKSRRPPISE